MKPPKSFYVGFIAGTFLGTLLLVVFVCGALLVFQKQLTPLLAARQAGQLQPPMLAHQVAGDLNWQVQDFVGNSVDMKSFSGKPLFLHFWSTECVACVSEIPSINRMNAELRDTGVQVVTVVRGSSDELVKDFARLRVDFPVFLCNEPRPKMFSPASQPATYILDTRGTIIFSHLGSAKWDDPASIAFLKAIPAMSGGTGGPGAEH